MTAISESNLKLILVFTAVYTYFFKQHFFEIRVVFSFCFEKKKNSKKMKILLFCLERK